MKTLFIKLSLLGVFLVVLNFLYKYSFYESDLQTHSPIVNLVRTIEQEEDEVVYLGESSNITFGATDLDKRAISDFIGDFFPKLKVGAMTKEASHAGVYYELLRNISNKSKVKTVVVTMNMRSFNANWIYSNLETPLQKSLVLIKKNPPLLNRLMLTLKHFDIKSEKEREIQFKEKWASDILKFNEPLPYKNVIEWDSTMAYNGIKNPDGTLNVPLTELACHYIKTYAFQINPETNPRIKDFDNIVRLAKERGWNLTFNLLAENISKADTLVGEQLVTLMKQNRDLLVKRYNKDGVTVVDNLELVEDLDFLDQNWTTEHYSEKGRRIIAKNVAKELKKYYPKYYTEVSYEPKSQFDFLNDCEGKLIWGQMQTLSTEKAYSGIKSSAIGKKEVYSITYEYPIQNLPDSLKQLSINMKIFQTSMNHDAKLMIEVSGKNCAYLLQPISIKGLIRSLKKWSTLNYNFSLPVDFNKGDLIKVFIYNPSNTLIYLDDFKIRFN